MKKVVHTVMALAMLLLVSACGGDRGKTYETEDSNENEVVNPLHIRPYSSLDSVSKMVTLTSSTIPTNGQLATEMVKVYYMPGRSIKGLVEQFNLAQTPVSQTDRMVGPPQIEVGGQRDMEAAAELEKLDREEKGSNTKQISQPKKK